MTTEPFAPSSQPCAPSPLRAAITAATLRSEPDCLPALLDAAGPSGGRERARRLVEALRRSKRLGGVEGLVQEYALSSQEGVALMCLAEALLRIPDISTRDALIRDKIAGGNWRAHLGQSSSPFVNAATWGLLVTGRLMGAATETTLASALTRLIARGGEPLIRRGVDMAMRIMGEQFVAGQTIDEALSRARRMEAKGFRHSYDMLGEAAATAEGAALYYGQYEAAVHAIGRASSRRGIVDGPGISIKLSALHPRYGRAQRDRVMAELLPRLQSLARLAHSYDIGLNIDAEEAARLELSLDLLEALCGDAALAGWDGIGFVVQAYGKRAPFVVAWLVDLARRTRHRLMVRLVKGAYWDNEIKRAQVEGLEDFPVFTRKVHTDVSYLACARMMLDAPDAVFPQFATHNAQTLAAVAAMAGPFEPGRYEFQCLHGMGEPLYEAAMEPGGPACRIYAPVGTHETLLAYLVRRLLENGANASFVNRIADPAVSIDDLVADPVAAVRNVQPAGAPHPAIALPRALFGAGRRNAAGLDLSDEPTLARLAAALRDGQALTWQAGTPSAAPPLAVRNPADAGDVVGHACDASPAEIEMMLAQAAASRWTATTASERAACLRRAADTIEARSPLLLSLLVREAGKTLADAVSEVREAVDFLRYYASEALDGRPLGPVACISPWNFPLAIFVGQAAGALAAGNPVLAKPADETPLVAAEAVRLLHEAGIPRDALQLVVGDGAAGAALVGDCRVQGVVFTGSTEVARAIQRQLAGRLDDRGAPVTLIAETGGQNAMIVDSSALPEQVVADVIASAFNSAGQRCSALRILCLQEEIADRTLAMLKGAMRELRIGAPGSPEIDIGPVISAQAQTSLRAHVAAMRTRGHAVEKLALTDGAQRGHFVAPTVIEIGCVADVEREVFGPVLHVLRYPRDGLDSLIDQINATGYGLTFGLHTRVDETMDHVLGRVQAGNVYVNRNMVGAVVGLQPFGGNGLSGTGPKAGGPLYLRRLMASAPAWTGGSDMPGPVGERNTHHLRPRGRLLALPASPKDLQQQLDAIFATGNTALLERSHPAIATLDPALAGHIRLTDDWTAETELHGVLFAGDTATLMRLNQQLADRPGAILPVILAGASGYAPEWLHEECTVSVNTAAAGGNASLMSIA